MLLWERPTRRIPLLPEPIVWDHESVVGDPQEPSAQLAGLGLPEESNMIVVVALTGWNGTRTSRIVNSSRGRVNFPFRPVTYIRNPQAEPEIRRPTVLDLRAGTTVTLFVF